MRTLEVNPEGYLPISEVARRYNRSYDTIYRWVRLGQFPPPIKLNGQNFWKPLELTAWEDAQVAA